MIIEIVLYLFVCVCVVSLQHIKTTNNVLNFSSIAQRQFYQKY